MSDIAQKMKQRDAHSLAKGYSRAFRRVEIAAIVGFAVIVSALVVKIAPHFGESPWLVLAAICSAYLAADFVSGFVHWMGDTWGSVETPLLGKALIRPFREHHVDQTAITRHDFVETNGSSCLISLPVAASALLIPLGPGDYHWLRLFATAFIAALCLWVMATNQLHKWAHATDETRPRFITWLQRMHLVLPPEHHAVHHTPPFAKYYCITVGWLNWPLTKLRFFPTLERIITAALGWLPRQDDIGTDAALELAPLPVEDRPRHKPLPRA